MRVIDWNMNYQVGIKWTDEAARIYRQRYKGFPDKEVDEDGFAWMPGWEMVSVFGNHIRFGDTPPFSLQIKIEMPPEKED